MTIDPGVARDPLAHYLFWRVHENVREFSHDSTTWSSVEHKRHWLRHHSTLERIVMWINLGWVPPE